MGKAIWVSLYLTVNCPDTPCELKRELTDFSELFGGGYLK